MSGIAGEPILSLHNMPFTELIRWTKGFGAPNVEGHDVGAMFEKSLKKFVRPARTAPALTAQVTEPRSSYLRRTSDAR